jgi:RNA polymerase sigma-70 factor (ECF subfamily)
MQALAMSAEEIAALLMRHRTDLYAYVRAVLRSSHDAEDVLQDVSVTVIRRADQFQPGTNFPAWAREIARFHLLEFGRRTGRTALLNPDVLERLEEAAARLEPEDRRRDALRECLSKLGGLGRQAMELRYAQALDVPRVAEAIGRTLQATYALLKRSRQQLRECAGRRMGQA